MQITGHWRQLPASHRMGTGRQMEADQTAGRRLVHVVPRPPRNVTYRTPTPYTIGDNKVSMVLFINGVITGVILAIVGALMLAGKVLQSLEQPMFIDTTVKAAA